MNTNIVIKTTCFFILMVSLQFMVSAQRAKTDTLYVISGGGSKTILNNTEITNYKPLRLILKRGKFYELKFQVMADQYEVSASGQYKYELFYFNGEDDTTFKNTHVAYLKSGYPDKMVDRKKGEKALSKIPIRTKIEEYNALDEDVEKPKSH